MTSEQQQWGKSHSDCNHVGGKKALNWLSRRLPINSLLLNGLNREWVGVLCSLPAWLGWDRVRIVSCWTFCLLQTIFGGKKKLLMGNEVEMTHRDDRIRVVTNKTTLVLSEFQTYNKVNWFITLTCYYNTKRFITINQRSTVALPVVTFRTEEA